MHYRILVPVFAAAALLTVGCAQEPQPSRPAEKPTQDPAATQPSGAKAKDSGGSQDAAFVAIDEFIAQQKIDKQGNWKTRLPKPPKLQFTPGVDYVWQIETNKGPMRIQLLPEAAPMHVSSLIYLARLGFYDGLGFHRVIPGFMAQGGDASGTGAGPFGYQLDLEVDPKFNFDKAGVLGAARRPDPNSAGSQFYISFKATPHLNQGYSVYGQLIDGMDTLRKLEAAGTPGGQPTEELKIVRTSVTAQPKDAKPAAQPADAGKDK